MSTLKRGFQSQTIQQPTISSYKKSTPCKLILPPQKQGVLLKLCKPQLAQPDFFTTARSAPSPRRYGMGGIVCCVLLNLQITLSPSWRSPKSWCAKECRSWKFASTILTLLLVLSFQPICNALSVHTIYSRLTIKSLAKFADWDGSFLLNRTQGNVTFVIISRKKGTYIWQAYLNGHILALHPLLGCKACN